MRPIISQMVLAFLIAATAHAQDFEVKLARSFREGQRYRYLKTFTTESRHAISFDASVRPPRVSKSTHQLKGEIEVLKVNPSGGIVVFKIKIDFLRRMTEGAGGFEDLGLPGDVIIATSTAEGLKFELADEAQGKLSDDAIASLKLIVEFGEDKDSKDLSSKDLFPLKARYKAGESSPVDANAVAKALKTKPDQVSGKLTLIGEKTHNGVACLELKRELSVNGITPDEQSVPKGAKIESVQMKMTASMLAPKDLTMPIMVADEVREMIISMKVVLPGQEHIETKVQSTSIETRHFVVEPVK